VGAEKALRVRYLIPTPIASGGICENSKINLSMEDKEAVKILMGLLDKRSLDKAEKEAILTAIGLLDLASLAEKSIKRKIKAQKAKRNKSLEW